MSYAIIRNEKYILSAVVHMDEETPHMHLVFIPVVHTLDKQAKEIDNYFIKFKKLLV